MELQRDEFSEMSFNPDTNALELWWSAGTASLTEERFRQGLEQFADHAVERGAPNLMVDLREFAYSPAPDMWEWRLASIVPLYHQAGVQKFANVVPQGWPLEEPKRGEGEDFLTGNFASVEEAEAWFRAP